MQIIAVLHLLLQTVSVTQKGHYFVPVRITGHLKHDLVSEVACQTVENRELREEHCLVFALVVCHLDADEQTLQVGEQALVFLHPGLYFLVKDIFNHFGRMALIFQLAVVFLFDNAGNPHLLILSQLLFVFLVALVQSTVVLQNLCFLHLLVYCYDLQYYQDVVIETCVLLALVVLLIVVVCQMGLQLFKFGYSQLAQLLQHHLHQKFRLQFVVKSYEGFVVVSFEIAQYNFETFVKNLIHVREILKVGLVQLFSLQFLITEGKLALQLTEVLKESRAHKCSLVLVDRHLSHLKDKVQQVQGNLPNFKAEDLEKISQLLGRNINKIKLLGLALLLPDHIFPILTVVLAHNLQKFKGPPVGSNAQFVVDVLIS